MQIGHLNWEQCYHGGRPLNFADKFLETKLGMRNHNFHYTILEYFWY